MGALWAQPDLAAMFRRLIEAEGRCRNREDGLRAAHDYFYRGPIAEAIVQFCRGNPVRDASGDVHAGLLTAEDFDDFDDSDFDGGDEGLGDFDDDYDDDFED